MARLKVSQKSLTKYSTLYRWNGHFGHLSEVIKNHKYLFWTFWTPVFMDINCPWSWVRRINAPPSSFDPLNKVQI